MSILVIVQNTTTGEIFDISSLCGTIIIDGYLDGQPGKMTCTLQRDPNEILQLANGSIVSVVVDEIGMFYGYIFTLGTDATQTYKLTAYDQLRYLKNKIILETNGQTASQIFDIVCKLSGREYFVRHVSNWVCSKYQHINQTMYSIVEYGLQQTIINSGKKYFVRDEFGVLVFADLAQELTDLIIGDQSLLTDYRYEISIDGDTANRARVYRIDEETGALQTWEVQDSTNIQRWGELISLQEAGKEMNEPQIEQLAYNVLTLKNRETKTMKLNAIGVKEIRPGTGFRLSLDSIGVKENMWVESVTHTIDKDLHLMQIEVFI